MVVPLSASASGGSQTGAYGLASRPTSSSGILIGVCPAGAGTEPTQRCPMGAGATAVCGPAAHAGTPRGRLPTDRRRYPVAHTNGLGLAQPADSLRSVVQGPLLLSAMGRGWPMGTSPPSLARSRGSSLLIRLNKCHCSTRSTSYAQQRFSKTLLSGKNYSRKYFLRWRRALCSESLP